MSAINVGFNFQNQNSTTFADGNFVLDDQTGIIGSLSGTINGKMIQGLSAYKNPDNYLYKEPYFGRGLTVVSHWSATPNGISFSDGTLQYNLSGTGRGFGTSAQFGDTLFVSDGTSRPVDFYTDYITETRPVCFVGGTLLMTARGEVAVEDLRAGDLAVTVSGALRPVVWTGHRHVAAGNLPLPHDQQPIRIRHGAFGAGLPIRDLSLSPGHPVLVGADADGAGGHLVPIMCLVNGTTIVREPVSSVTYWHIELDVHDILLAEGLAAESYLDWGDRSFFDEGSDHVLNNPDVVVPGLAARCRPVAVEGPVVEAERRRLSAVFHAEMNAQCFWDAADDFGVPAF